MNYCDKCGGPLRPKRFCLLEDSPCRLCDLDRLCEMPFMRFPLTATREAALGRWWMTAENEANSTANTPATSRWLPPGQRELRPARSSTERACQMWLRDVQEREEAGEWRRRRVVALNAPTFDDYMRAVIDAVDRMPPDPVGDKFAEAGRAVGRIFADGLLSPLAVWPGEPVDEDDIVRQVMDGPARRV